MRRSSEGVGDEDRHRRHRADGEKTPSVLARSTTRFRYLKRLFTGQYWRQNRGKRSGVQPGLNQLSRNSRSAARCMYHWRSLPFRRSKLTPEASAATKQRKQAEPTGASGVAVNAREAPGSVGSGRRRQNRRSAVRRNELKIRKKIHCQRKALSWFRLPKHDAGSVRPRPNSRRRNEGAEMKLPCALGRRR